MTKIGKIVFLVFFLYLAPAFGVVKVQSFADRREMGLGDTIDVAVQVSSSDSVEVAEPQLPDLPDFEIMNSWTSSSTSSKLVQGAHGMEFQSQKQMEFHYMLAPKKQGNLPIPAFEVTIDGKVMKTAPFLIRVSGPGSGANQVPKIHTAQGDEDLDEAEKVFDQLLNQRGRQAPKAQVVPKNPNESFFIHVDLDKTEVYEGEQITASWYIFSRGNILALDRLKFPDLRGFWKEIIEEVPALNFTQEVLNGVAYRKALLASHALFPIKPGTSVVDEYKVKATIQLPSSPFGAFGFGQPYSYTRSSDRISIKVKPLPSEGKPQDFSGAVGQFDVQASVEQKEVPVNQPFSLKLRFEGEGNAKLIELPPLAMPTGLESYDTKSDSKFFKNGRSYKEFEILLIPRTPGEVTIPGISVSLFDPKTSKYYTKKTNPLTVKVTGSQEPIAKNDSSKGEGKPAQAPAVPEDLPAILTTYEGPARLAKVPWMIFAGASVLAFATLGLKGRRELGRREKKATIKELLAGRMKKVNKSLKANEWREASAQMTNMIYSVLGAISGEGGASQELKILLEKSPPSLRRELGAELEKTLDLFQFLSFAPEEAIGDKKQGPALQAEISKAEKLLSRAIDHIDPHDAR